MSTPIEPCTICRDHAATARSSCVVEDVGDLWALERAGVVKARYHVLGGTLSPLDGVGPEDLAIERLVARVAEGGVTEVVLALNATVDGQTTAHYVTDLLAARASRSRARPWRAGRRRTRLSRRGHPGGRDAQPHAVLSISRRLAASRRPPLRRRSPTEFTRSTAMAQLVITYWRDIPAQVTAKQGRTAAKRELSAALHRGDRHGGDALGRRRHRRLPRRMAARRRRSPATTNLEAAVEAATAQIEADYDKERLVALGQEWRPRGGVTSRP